MATKEQITLRLTSVAVPVDRDKKIRTALSTHQIAGFVTVPSEKTIHPILASCKVIFLEKMRAMSKIFAPIIC